jgi:predicted Zn-dependent protease
LIVRRSAVIFAFALLTPPLQPQDASPAQIERAVTFIAKGDGASALTVLRPLTRRYPSIADYIAFWTAQALVLEKDHAAAVQAVEPVFRQQPESPLAGRAALLAASSLLELNNPRGALTMLARVPETRLPQPESLAVLARAREAVDDPVAAALAWQSVYFAYPASAEAKDAGDALSRLETSLGAAYPPPMASSRFDRAEKLLKARRFRDARNELLGMIPLFDGPTRETAKSPRRCISP